MIHLIAALGENNVIGRDNGIPWQIPADLQHFKALTTGHTIIMGRKTYESIGRVLPNRENIIISSTLSFVDGALVASSLEEGIKAASNKEVFIIGGSQLYAEALPMADQLDITRVHFAPEGDTWFPEVDWSQYQEVWRSEYDGSTDGVPNCTFLTYRKRTETI